MDSARTAVFASRCRQVPILYSSKLLLATSLLVIFASTGMCSRAHAIFTLPEGASLESFTRLKVRPEVSGENISVTRWANLVLKTRPGSSNARNRVRSFGKTITVWKGGIRSNEQPTLSPKSYCAAFSWKIGRSYDKWIKPDADRASVRGPKQQHG